MALNQKYSTLPDLDTAPDIYETPDLTDDHSSVPTNTAQSPSEDELDDAEPDQGVVKQRLRPSDARSRFITSNVNARDVDFSDRVSSKRKSYKVTTRRHRIYEDGTEDFGDLSDDDEAETLARKITRLKREVEEARAEYARQQATATESSTEDSPGVDIDSLSRALESMAGLDKLPELASRNETSVTPPTADSLPTVGDAATYTVTYAPTYQQTHALAKAADFDKRLLLLEMSLGIGSSASPELDAGGLSRAVLPTLETLSKQIGTLSSASTASLDAVSRRVRTLIQDAKDLEKSRSLAKAAQDALMSTSPSAADVPETKENKEKAEQEEEHITKINALYGTLSTIENLRPLLPPLLDRLRSLRAIHADAATAGETLDNIEKNQGEMAAEIKAWREGLDKVEAAMKEGEASMEGNSKIVEGWIKDLEQRVARLS